MSRRGEPAREERRADTAERGAQLDEADGLGDQPRRIVAERLFYRRLIQSRIAAVCSRPFLRRLELLRERVAWTIVVKTKNQQRKVFCPCRAHVTNGIREFRAAIGQVVAQFVVRNDQDSDVDVAVGERIAKMANVHHQQVASGRDLNLNANADAGTVDGVAFRPIDGSAFLNQPPAGLSESVIEDLADGSAAVCVFRLLHEQLEAREYLGQFLKKWRQAEALDTHQDIRIFALLGDLRHRHRKTEKTSFGGSLPASAGNRSVRRAAMC